MADHGFNIAANFGPVSGRCGGRFGHGDDAAIWPRAGGNSGDSCIQIGKAQLQLLPTRSLRPKQISLPYRAGVLVRKKNAQSNHVGADREKWICPLRGFVNIDIEALGGERNLFKLGALLIVLGSLDLRLMLGLFGVFCQPATACSSLWQAASASAGSRATTNIFWASIFL